MRCWIRHASKMLVRDRWLHLTADRCETPSGVVLDPFYVLHDSDWVHVFARNREGEVLVVRQYRYAANAICVELPGGAVDSGETPLEAAKRELLEETGHHASAWSSIGWMFANPARQTNKIHIFAATGLEQARGQSLEPSEDIEFQFMEPMAIKAAILDGQFSQAFHIASYYRSLEHLNETRRGA